MVGIFKKDFIDKNRVSDSSFLEFYEKNSQSFKKFIKKLMNFSIPKVMQSESKSLEVKLLNYHQKEVAVAVIVLLIKQVFKHFLTITEVYKE